MLLCDEVHNASRGGETRAAEAGIDEADHASLVPSSPECVQPVRSSTSGVTGGPAEGSRPTERTSSLVAVPTWQAASAGRPAQSLLTDAVGASPTGDLPLSHLSLERMAFVYTLQCASRPLTGSPACPLLSPMEPAHTAATGEPVSVLEGTGRIA